MKFSQTYGTCSFGWVELESENDRESQALKYIYDSLENKNIFNFVKINENCSRLYYHNEFPSIKFNYKNFEAVNMHNVDLSFLKFTGSYAKNIQS